jgi:hypothetical protein
MYLGTIGIFFTLKIYMSKNNYGACHRPHGWTPLPLCPLAASLPLAAPSARFVYLIVSSLVVALSPKTPAPCHPIIYCNHRVVNLSCEIIHLYEVIRYTCATLRILLLHLIVASLKRRHYTVNGRPRRHPKLQHHAIQSTNAIAGSSI